ncbi:enoyl-CoA hydratase/isomerase family protein [Streptomyces sp. NA04227]|uniref:enoyl-CoA hydratase/isomerase family protein n=1 Tax=Streptomyces sp. NA04227 TaxID=2742136 RepID=UPI0015904619|nr:enoyl-CoA hydratase/isomerase family protein [Streptomyces sp. NA04227]QKW10418.1 enoyl-CoA hydratase/isomerase family protein [Streptomyces sp. NA04227]
MPKLERDGEVFILHLEPDDENRFHPDFLDEVTAVYDEIEAESGPRALVTVGSGKFWSNGLDLEWVGAHGDQTNAYLERVQAMLARTLASPVVTVAAVNGHAFAAGAMWSLAHDFRVMRADRGYFCLPEVDMGLAFIPGMNDLLLARLAPHIAHEAMTTGRRYGGEQALAAHIVDAVAAEDEVLAKAVELARPLAVKATDTRARIKETMYTTALASLRATVQY